MSDLPPPPGRRGPPETPPGWGRPPGETAPGWGGDTSPPPPPPPPRGGPGGWHGQGLRPVGDFLSASFTAIGRAALPMLPIFAVCAAPLVLLFLVADATLGFTEYVEELSGAETDPATGELVLPEWDVDVGTAVAFGVAIGLTVLVVGLVVSVTGVLGTDRGHRDEPMAAGQLMSGFGRSLLPVLGLVLTALGLGVLGLAVLALLTAVLPLVLLAALPVAVWVAVRLSLAFVVSVIERRAVTALPRSWQLTRGHFWGVFGRLLLFWVILSLATQVVGVPLQFASVLGSVVVALSTVVLTLVQLASSAFGAAGTVVLYRDLADGDRSIPAPPSGPWQRPRPKSSPSQPSAGRWPPPAPPPPGP